jgi:hypothetical protein
MKVVDKLMYIGLEDDLFWAASCQGFAFGPLLNDYKVPDLKTDYISKGHMYSVFDSASNTIQLPDIIFNHFVDALSIEVGKFFS